MIAAIVFLGIVLFLIVALPPLISDAGFGTAGEVIFGILRWPILGAVMLVGIGLLYRFSVKESPRGWSGFLTTGTVVAAVGWLVVSGLFAVYTASFASYGKTYGALASIVVVLLWLWLSALVVLAGAEVDGAEDDAGLISSSRGQDARGRRRTYPACRTDADSPHASMRRSSTTTARESTASG